MWPCGSCRHYPAPSWVRLWQWPFSLFDHRSVKITESVLLYGNTAAPSSEFVITSHPTGNHTGILSELLWVTDRNRWHSFFLIRLCGIWKKKILEKIVIQSSRQVCYALLFFWGEPQLAKYPREQKILSFFNTGKSYQQGLGIPAKLCALPPSDAKEKLIG